MVSKATKARANEFYRALGAKLRPHGFRGSGGHWHFKHEFATVSIGVLIASRHGLNLPISFAIGLGIDELYDRYPHPTRLPYPKSKRASYCHYGRSIGWLNEHLNPDPFMTIRGDDELIVDYSMSLKIRSYTTDEQFAERLYKAETLLVDYGIPMFESFLDRAALVDHLIEMPGTSIDDKQYMLWLAEALTSDQIVSRAKFHSKTNI